MSQAAHATETDAILRPSQEEWDAAVNRELAALGLTYAELADQARRKDFQSDAAMNLWVIIGEPRG